MDEKSVAGKTTEEGEEKEKGKKEKGKKKRKAANGWRQRRLLPVSDNKV